MRSSYFRTIISLCLIFNLSAAFGQSAKKLYKTAKELSKAGNYEEAIDYYSKCIETDNKFINAYIERAFAYEETENIEEAAADYKLLTELLPGDYKYYYKAAKLNYQLNKYTIALKDLKTAAQIENKDAKIFELKMRCNIALKNFSDALTDCNKAIELNKTAENYYFRGLVYKMLENFLLSESDFLESTTIDPNYLNAHTGLAVVYLKQNKYNDALNSVNKALKTDCKNKDALLLRSQIFTKKSDFPSAINDLSKLIIEYQNDFNILFQRGQAYFENKQFDLALTDFKKVTAAEPDNIPALCKRAESYEKLGKQAEAITDYEKILSLKIAGKENEQINKLAAERLFELNREQNPPQIKLFYGKPITGNSIFVSGITDEISLILSITDKSTISRLTVDGKGMIENNDSLKSGIPIKLSIKNKTKVTIECEDIYKNKSIEDYKIIKQENTEPSIVLSTPLVSEKNEIYADPRSSELLIEGRVNSKITLDIIEVNGIKAIFNADEINPKFTVRIYAIDRTKVEIKLTDINGNSTVKVFIINRNPSDFLNDNPMGITWVVFIENSDYKSFTSFKGPAKDISMMKTALSKYQINNILHKKNMSKQQFEKFFSTELRDLVKENKVNSVLIWYAGLGKYIKEKSYWIPSDAKRDDESSYFNINSLKSSMQAYSKEIEHTLLVTDACETGPSFYMAMRALPTERDCNTGKATKFKSSQVFTSAGYEAQDEKSQFTKSFANSLNSNNNSCISIEKIVQKVSSAVVKSTKKTPKFGKISGFEDEDGSFIFIKK